MTTPTFQEQMHFMSCQAEMLDEQGNDVSAGVMRDASKVLVVEHKRAMALEAEVYRLNEALEKAIDTQGDQILKMTDQQIEALCRLEGHDPKDEATIAKQVCEIALLKHELSKVTKTQTEVAITQNDKRWRILEHGCQWVSWTPTGGETHSFDPRDLKELQRMRAWADETIEKRLAILRDGIAKATQSPRGT